MLTTHPYSRSTRRNSGAHAHSAARVGSSRGARAPRRLLRRARLSPNTHRAVAAAQRRLRGTMWPSIDTLSASVLGGRCALWSDARGARARSASLSMSSRSCSTSVACTLERSDAHDVLSTSLVGRDVPCRKNILGSITARSVWWDLSPQETHTRRTLFPPNLPPTRQSQISSLKCRADADQPIAISE